MGIFDGLLGKKKSVSSGLICAKCGKLINASPRRAPGVIIYEGTECNSCGKAYCLYCHNFSSQGPKCPGCGQYQLGPILRSA